jgi:hypothetical protein
MGAIIGPKDVSSVNEAQPPLQEQDLDISLYFRSGEDKRLTELGSSIRKTGTLVDDGIY